MSEALQRLRDHGIRPSYQRAVILDHLMMRKDHPTAEEVFHALRDEVPTLSLTTVYSTLRLFVRQSLAQMVTVEEGVMRFDGNCAFHVHFKCRSCGRVLDIPCPTEVLREVECAVPRFYRVESIQLHYGGLCQECGMKRE